MKNVLISALICVSFGAQAEFYTGNELLQRINSESSSERSLAVGYVMGVADTTMGVSHCPPPEATSGQMRDMLRNYLNAFPQERHHSADILVVRVLRTAWPCAQRNNNRGGSTL